MRIAILTLPLHTNYGGILQCYALQTVLQRMGHDVKVLSRPRYRYLYYMIYPFALCKRLLKYVLTGGKYSVLRSPNEVIRQNTDEFIRKHISFYCKRNWTSKLSCYFDVIIVGSDQIWRPAYYRPIEEAFLSFLKDTDIRRVAYAASFGVENCDEYTESQLRQCSCLLHKFDAVSVREFSGIDICLKYFGIKACQKLDPTLLLSKEDYSQLVESEDKKSIYGNLLVYFLDETLEKKEIVKLLTLEKELVPFSIGANVDNKDLSLNERIQMPVGQWIAGFEKAKFIITDSFHGCVFSIIFRKPFIAIGNAERGITRFISLLKLFNIEYRLIYSLEDYINHKEVLLQQLDYNRIEEKLQLLRNDSVDFLNKALYN